MKALLERTRAINRVLQREDKVEFNTLSQVLSGSLDANIYIVNNEGRVLGYALLGDFECRIMCDKVLDRGVFPEYYADWLARHNEVTPNLTLNGGICAFSDGEECLFQEKFSTVAPIFGGGERLGTLIVAKFDVKFTDADMILTEYGATVVGMEFLRDRSEKVGEEARQHATVQVALNTLSYSELEAIVHILNELNGNEGLLVASKIADRVGITRSVIVNALRKFESAGVIESKSLGMKGTYIRVLNERLLEELKKMK
jgi:GTP-sensing transcriptional pleiotropic repressor CodY